MTTRRFVLLLTTFLLAASADAGELKLAAIFSDRMVLQRNQPVPVWGRADPGAKLAVAIGDAKAAATADANGKWRTKVGPLKAGGPLVLTVSSGDQTLKVSDVLVGEVWLCSGQSNMAMTVRGCINAAQEIRAADLPKIRHWQTARLDTRIPPDDCSGSWVVCSPKTVAGFTAAGYFFGRELHKPLDVPIGLINSSVGGTPIEKWTNRLPVNAAAATGKVDPNSPEMRELREDYFSKMVLWRRKAAAEKDRAKRNKMRAPAPPKALAALYASRGGLYNGMIAPLVGYGIRGAIWYQGEANAGRGYVYRDQLAAMITGWREVWGQGDFPFGVVQLPNFRARATEPGDASWAVIRESQAAILKLPATGVAVTIDVGDEKNIHPRNKQAVGKRLGLWALAKAYDKEIVYSGPMYKAMTVEGGSVRVKFDHVGGGLACAGEGELKGFAVAGEDRKWVWAEAKIDGETVVVNSKDVARPVAVRYAWGMNPECNLANKESLPAGPFRTDDWQVTTQPKPKE